MGRTSVSKRVYKKSVKMGDVDKLESARLLDNDSEDEDDFFLHGPTSNGIRKQLNEVTDIARNNVLKLADRGEKLDILEERSVRLDDTAANFRSGAYHLKRKTWWHQAKFKAVGASGLVVLLFLVIIIIVGSQ